ncbi:MAG: hypothetical protein A2X82_18260 [Geobacteraceae bacterium GWC2_55_20]|nr:MAG: hypothetical protein A2X82_18260 [Geobacteraceae bacterium GWC2_55_20]OGU26355.1 MAG: hypothetical protein A2X85_15880 [Geobacteraceae bacterium GWF2_54_21]HBA70810.1 hypothetical protein [Geobacter sp.]HCE68120.1 hypothetical protein [Geobacter sp.]
MYPVSGLLAAAVLIVASIAVPAGATGFHITIQAPARLLASPVASSAINDTGALLQQSLPSAKVSINGRTGSEVLIILPDTDIPTDGTRTSPPAAAMRRLPLPDRSYRWKSGSESGRTVLRLQARSAEGVACGLYGLLQGKLGFRFHHPRESVIPKYRRWPLPGQFTFSGRPRFEKSGFHLHTMHPIELTEQLLNPDYPNAFEDLACYIDWLARNGQNTMQFVLLRGIDRARWPRHAARVVEHAHRRGVICGVQISLSMLQQQAFQAITLLQLYPSYTRQVDDTLAWLFQAPWDFISLEPTMGEHLPFLGRLVPHIQLHLERQVAERYRSLLLLGTHVIGGEDAPREPRLAGSGILVHSVMCYSVTETNAPVYGNRNQCFMLRTAQKEQPRRETWYWPESSYWVGFDTPVPLLLLPYLDARHQDLETMAGVGVNGHLTFSSGWEWGYWLIDWSIARWAWEYRNSRAVLPSGPLTPLLELLPDPRLQPLWKEALRLQNFYLKERDLMRFMAAATPFSELPPPFDKPFQPAPEFHYSRLFKSASRREVDLHLGRPIRELEGYAREMGTLSQRMEAILAEGGDRAGDPAAVMRLKLARELTRALAVTSLRASHRALTLKALSARVGERSAGRNHNGSSGELLVKARLVRHQALALVKQQESGYRYPLPLLADRRDSMTAYPFGYLYPAGRLFFWEREEQQVEQGRFDPLFMNLWDMRRTLGLGSLFFR